MNGWSLIVALSLAGALPLAVAREAPKTMTRFNIACPAKQLLPRLESAYRQCRAGKEAECARFVSTLRQLLPEYDCQRPFDATPSVNYIVPAIWLAGDATMEKYFRLLSELPRDDASRLFASGRFRAVLDGFLAEQYHELSEQRERTLESRGKQRPDRALEPDARKSGARGSP